MHVAIAGCLHGEIEKTYDYIESLEKDQKIKISLLLVCGDFQAIRNKNDLKYLKCPKKYVNMGSFYKYFKGEKKTKLMTIVIGGNHESTAYNHSLYYGGWLAPNIYYLGYCGVVNFNGLKVAGLSGIFNEKFYFKGHFERFPFNERELKSFYCVRKFDVDCLNLLKSKIHILMTHDWPRDIVKHGNINYLLKRKSFLQNEIKSGKFGSIGGKSLLDSIKPEYFFSAHMHIKYSAIYNHKNEPLKSKTKFLALGKPKKNFDFVQIINLKNFVQNDNDLYYDTEWLSILKSTGSFFPVKRNISEEMEYNFFKLKNDKNLIISDFIANFGSTLKIPKNFTTETKEGEINPQTKFLIEKLELKNPYSNSKYLVEIEKMVDEDEIELD